MSSQPNEKGSGVPDALVKELLRRQRLPADAHVNVSVHTARVRLNPDGTRTVLSDSDYARGIGARRRRPPRWAGVLLPIIGFVQLTYGLWAAHSDSLATALLRRSASCQLAQLTPQPGDEMPAETIPTCRVEKAVVIEHYISTSRRRSYYHIVTLTPLGKRDNVALVAWAGTQLWNRVQPTERISLQRFVRPGYHLTGSVLALADSAGAALTRSHPDSGAQNNLVNILMGGVLFVAGLTLFVQANAAAERAGAA
jgi:hypothetical protein